MRILLLAPNYDQTSPGESWSTYKWVQGMSACCDATVLTQHLKGWREETSPVSALRVINWNEPRLPGLGGRIGWELKPGYVFYYFRARQWIRAALRAGECFDLVHQINPLALRYPCPARGLGIPYLMGPLAGSLSTPPGMQSSTPERQWYRRLRGLDAWRLRHDPWLRDSYRGAAAVIGVAPYVEAVISACRPSRFEIMSETGIESVSAIPKRAPGPGEPLRLLFVGRLIRTKGVLEAIEAVAAAAQHAAITFDIVGAGELADDCARLIKHLGLSRIVNLHGRLPRDQVFAWYEQSHVFLFPSYREPSGNVVFEAMSRGLPVITASVGGPGFVVTPQCGLQVDPTNRAQYVAGLADAIRELVKSPERIPKLSAGAIDRIRTWASWPDKYRAMHELYRQVVGLAS